MEISGSEESVRKIAETIQPGLPRQSFGELGTHWTDFKNKWDVDRAAQKTPDMLPTPVARRGLSSALSSFKSWSLFKRRLDS